jgi:acetyltransferase-like isoleucine patch superfamily enzyme
MFGKIKSLFWILKRLNLKTVVFNFKHLPFKLALCFPFLISRNVIVKGKGKYIIDTNQPFGFGMIRVGYSQVGIFHKRRDVTILENNGQIIFHGKANLGLGSRLSVLNSGTLIFGIDFNITANGTIICSKEIAFGNNCLMSWDTTIMDTDFHSITFNNMSTNLISKPIKIGNKVWIGLGATILKGSHIKENTVIGAKSLIVPKEFNSNSLIAGIPAKTIKSIHTWKI